MRQPEGHENRQRRSAPHLNVLRDQQNFAALSPIRDHSTDQGEQKDGNPRQELIESQQER